MLLEAAGGMRKLSSCLEDVDDAAAARDEAVEARGLVEEVVDGLQWLVNSSGGVPSRQHAEVRNGKETA